MFFVLKCLKLEGLKVSIYNCGNICFYLGFKIVVFVVFFYFVRYQNIILMLLY